MNNYDSRARNPITLMMATREIVRLIHASKGVSDWPMSFLICLPPISFDPALEIGMSFRVEFSPFGTLDAVAWRRKFHPIRLKWSWTPDERSVYEFDGTRVKGERFRTEFWFTLLEPQLSDPLGEMRKGLVSEKSYIYLASPYSNSFPEVCHARYIEAMHATAWLLKRGIWVYSPIVHCHEMAREFGLPTDAKYWEAYNHVMISQARELWVLKIDGWQESKGVAEEIAFAKALRKRVVEMAPPE